MKKIFKFINLRKRFLLILAILLLACFFRFWRIAKVPPSLNWDEVAIGYNAYSILKTGRDEWGVKFPLLGFQSFGEYKLPVFIYSTIPGVALFGLNAWGVRLAPALFGVIGVLISFYIAKEIFKNNKLAVITAFLLATSVWHLQITRAAFEAGLAQLLISLAILFLLKSRQKSVYLIISILAACLAVYTYNSSRIFVPIFYAVAFLTNRKIFLKNRGSLIIGLIIIILFALPLLLNFNKPVVQGRYELISIQDDPGFTLRINSARGQAQQTGWPKPIPSLIHNKVTHYGYVFAKNYLSHFSPAFLFVAGADHNQQSPPDMGQFMWVWAPFLVIGLILLLYKAKRDFSWPMILVIAQLLIAPFAASTTMNAIPHALRTFCSLPAWQIVIALGVNYTSNLTKNSRAKKLFWVLLGLLFCANFGYYLYKYHRVYPEKYSRDWQYGYRQAINYVNERTEKYDRVYLSRDYGEPYIFWLFYTQYPPQKYQIIDKERVKRHDWVWTDRFGKFYFPDFSDPGSSVLELYEKNKDQDLVFIGMPEDIPQEWKTGVPIFTIARINFLNSETAFEIAHYVQ